MQKSHLHFVVDIDIKGFFDNVNHSKLIKQMWNIGIQDKKLLCVIKEMLKALIVLPNGDTILPPERNTARRNPIASTVQHCS